NYTLVGAVANQASRLEGLNKIYGTDILASGEVAKPTVSRFIWRYIDRVVAAGTTEALEIYEPLGEIAAAARHAEFLDLWRTAPPRSISTGNTTMARPRCSSSTRRARSSSGMPRRGSTGRSSSIPTIQWSSRTRRYRSTTPITGAR